MARNIETREGYEFWDRLCRLQHYSFFLGDGPSVRRVEDGTGNWIEVYGAQSVMDDAQSEVNELREQNAALEAEAQALREEVAQLKQFNVTLNEENTRLFADWEKADQEVATLRAERKDLTDARLERDELRARVVVVPDSILPHRERSSVDPGFNEALRQVARLNGKSISAETLRRIDLVLAALTSYDMRGIINSTIGSNWREQVAEMRGELRELLDEGEES